MPGSGAIGLAGSAPGFRLACQAAISALEKYRRALIMHGRGKFKSDCAVQRKSVRVVTPSRLANFALDINSSN